jgi:hypothetical protein
MQALRSNPLKRTQAKLLASSSSPGLLKLTFVSLGSYSRDRCHQGDPAIYKACRRRFRWHSSRRSRIQLYPFDPSLRIQLIPIVSFLRTLPLPATHPSHPAALAIQSTLRDAQRGYGEMRGSWSRKCLEPHAKRLLDRSESVDGVLAGREIGAWVENMLTVAEVRLYVFNPCGPHLTREIRRNTISCPISHQSLHHRWSPPHSVPNHPTYLPIQVDPILAQHLHQAKFAKVYTFLACPRTRRYLNRRCIGRI